MIPPLAPPVLLLIPSLAQAVAVLIPSLAQAVVPVSCHRWKLGRRFLPTISIMQNQEVSSIIFHENQRNKLSTWIYSTRHFLRFLLFSLKNLQTTSIAFWQIPWTLSTTLLLTFLQKSVCDVAVVIVLLQNSPIWFPSCRKCFLIIQNIIHIISIDGCRSIWSYSLPLDRVRRTDQHMASV